MKNSYMEYAMSVIVSRALPDVRDGLKPVHRRILYAMSKLNLEPSKAYKKCASIVGETMGKYHPHGDSAIYDALVRMAQDFSMRYMLVDGHGNFGSVDGYPAAASRYTEAKLSRISVEMLSDIEKNTVDFIDNYDSSEKEPEVLPSKFPNLLVNGSSGIAVGMATNIPPHNLTEVLDALLKIIDNNIIEQRETELSEITSIIQGPDFPTGATILGKSGIKDAYTSGRGKIRVRSKAEIKVNPNNNKQSIIITEIPYQVNKSRMIEKFAELVKDKKVEGIADINDESDRNGIKIVIECKKDINASIVLNQLYKFSQLQESYSVNFLAIVDGEPKTLNILQILELYLKHQEDITTRRINFDLNKARNRVHIVDGLLKALSHIDEIIEIIKTNKNIKESRELLVDKFNFTDKQVDAIIEMRLRSLSGLERERLEDEYTKLSIFTHDMQDILDSNKKLLEVIKADFIKTKEKFGDERRTEIIKDEGELFTEDFINDDMSVITMTHLEYIKRLPLSTYKSQKRGGKGIKGMKTRETDFVRDLFLSSNHSYIFFFTNKGKVYRLKTFEIQEAGRTAKGTPIINLINLEEDEKVTAVIPVRQEVFSADNLESNLENNAEESLIMTTKKGIIKKTKVSMFKNVRKKGLRAININENDELISVQKVSAGDNMFITSKLGMSIRFDESQIKNTGRTTIGVIAIRLKDEEDYIVSSEVLKKDEDKKIIIVTENGFGKCSANSEYRLQARGGKGLKAYKITPKTGNIIDVKIIDEKEELIIITSEGIVIRLKLKDISVTSRLTQGVKLIDIPDGVKVVSIAKIDEEDVEIAEENLEEENLEEVEVNLENQENQEVELVEDEIEVEIETIEINIDELAQEESQED
ncbi:MAG: DNA gyrase subunit A [bacterium]